MRLTLSGHCHPGVLDSGDTIQVAGSQNGLLSGWDVKHITSALPTELLGAFV